MGERQTARTMVQILQDQVDSIQEELHKAEEVLAMLVGVVKTIHHQHDKPHVVDSGKLEVDLEDGLTPAPFTGTPYDANSEED